MGCPNCGKGWFNTLCNKCAGKGDALTTARKIALAVSVFDGITPIIRGLEIIANDPPVGLNTWTFFLDYDLAIQRGWSLAHIQDLLEKHSIHTYGALVSPLAGAHFGVRLNQAAWAEHILNKYEVPIKEISQGAPHPAPHLVTGRGKR